MKNILFIAIFIGLIGLQIYNHFAYNYKKGLDADGHLEYIQYIQIYHQLPPVGKGWEFHQPPAYYLITSALTSVKSMQWVNVLSWLGICITAMLAIRSILPEQKLQAVVLAGSIPVSLYLSHTISNELFCSMLVSLALMLICIFRHQLTFTRSLIIATVLGLAWATKATALVAVIAAVLYYLINRQSWKHIVVMTIIPVIIGAWFTISHYFISTESNTAAPTAAASQPKQSRNLAFFIDITPFFKMDLFKAHWYAFIPGTHFSFFWDGHNILIPIQPYSKIGNIIIGLSFVFIPLSVRGFYSMIKQKQLLIFPMYTILMLAAYTAYNFWQPYYYTVKATFISSLILPFVVSVFVGSNELRPILKNGVNIITILFSTAVIYAFWIRPGWY